MNWNHVVYLIILQSDGLALARHYQIFSSGNKQDIYIQKRPLAVITNSKGLLICACVEDLMKPMNDFNKRLQGESELKCSVCVCVCVHLKYFREKKCIFIFHVAKVLNLKMNHHFQQILL
jgi:hypothetical protein